MKKTIFAIDAEKGKALSEGVIRALVAAVLCAGRTFGGYAPFALGWVAAAGERRRGFSALVGGLAGAVLLLDFSHALRTCAGMILLFTANNAFCETKLYRARAFLPLITLFTQLSVELVYVVNAGAEEAAGCLLSILLSALCALCYRLAAQTKRRDGGAMLVVIVSGLAAVSSFELSPGVSPGRAAAMLFVMLFAFGRDVQLAVPGALCTGLAMDLVAGVGGFLHTGAYALAALAMRLSGRAGRVGAAGLFSLAVVLTALPLPARQGMALLYEGLCAVLLFLLLPGRVFRVGKRQEPDGSEPDAGQRRLSETALALFDLYDSLMSAPRPPEENPAVIFDRAAEAVCRDCELCTLCWQEEYQRTYSALNDATTALLARGEGRGADFPRHFSEHCVRFPRFLGAVNTEVRAYLMRRDYRARLDDTRSRAAGQYAQFSELLSAAAERGEAQPTLAPIPYQLGAALRAKEGESVSGDSMSTFETEDGELCLLLSDGMGSGEAARRESALAVRLLERFLRAGIAAPPALKTLNSALALRAENAESFTTIDLLVLSLSTGEGELYKYGAAPSYIKKGGKVGRITCTCLPAGLQREGDRPEATRVQLEPGSFFIMVTDGVADALDDEWLRALLETWEGDNPQTLVSDILRAARERERTADDEGILVLHLPAHTGAV